MKEQTFYIVYDGPALANHEMDVRQLAPALHALGDLMEAANRVVNGKAFKTQVKVRGSFKTGCFGIDFVYAQKLLESFAGLFTSQYVEAALNLASTIGLMGGCAMGLIKFVSWLKGRIIRQVVELDNGKVRVEVDDDHIEIEKKIIELFQDLEVRKALEALIKTPLETDGIDSFGSGKDAATVQLVRKHEAVYFAAPELAEELISESSYETAVKVVNIAFQEENMWRLSEGGTPFYAKIEDPEFLAEVQQNERVFAKDDIFIVMLRRKQFLGDKGNVKSEYAVERVLSHRSAARQIQLPFKASDED